MSETSFIGGKNPWSGLMPDTAPEAAPAPLTKKRGAPRKDRKPSIGSAGTSNTTDRPKQHRGGKPRANVEAMRVEFDRPLPHGRAVPIGGFYANLFEKMKPKACIVCDPREVYAVASAMRTWIRRMGKEKVWSTRTELRSDADCKGRVWCWPEPPPLKGKR